MIAEFLKNDTGKFVFSVLIGIGLALCFRKACSGNNCFIIKAPKTSDINNYVYKIDDECYKYTAQAAHCNDK